MRELLEEVDGEEMTFLMHAVTGCCEGTADEAESEMKKKQKEREKKHRQKEKKNNQLDVGKVNFTTFTTVEPTAGAPESKGEESKEGNELEEGQSVTSGSGAASAANATPLENEAEREIPSATTSSEPHGGQDNQQAASSSTSKFKVLEKELLVFRVAWLLVKEVLWKEQVLGLRLASFYPGFIVREREKGVVRAPRYPIDLRMNNAFISNPGKTSVMLQKPGDSPSRPKS